MLTFVAVGFLAFFIGSIPSGFIVGKIYGVDIRRHGSGNTGATNAGRILGKKAGLITLACDVIKGFLALMLASLFPMNIFPTNREFAAFLGICALFGHCFSPFLHFRGGKGVATGGGVFLALAPLQTAIALGLFAISLRWLRFVSLSSMIAAVTVPLLLVLSADESNRRLAPFAAICSMLIIYRHRANIARLRAGTEPRQGGKPKA